MELAVIRAGSRAALMAEARRQMGDDPLLLEVRRKRGEGLEWEAVVGREDAPSAELPLAPPADEAERTIGGRQSAPVRAPGLRPRRTASSVPRRVEAPEVEAEEGPRTREVFEKAQALSSFVDAHAREARAHLGWAGGVALSVRHLREAGMSRAEVEEIVAHAAETAVWGAGTALDAQRAIRHALESRLLVADDEASDADGVRVFVGTRGSGRATIAAKVAVDLRTRGYAPTVGVVSVVPEARWPWLELCAGTLEVDFVSVGSRHALASLMEERRGPVVLVADAIDPLRPVEAQPIGRMLASVEEIEVHGVVSAAFGSDAMDVSLRAARDLGAVRLSATHLDECPALGRIACVSYRLGLPVAYLSAGPQVTSDLLRPSRAALLEACCPLTAGRK